MSRVEFDESGMRFSFPEEDIFRIENCSSYKSLGEGIKICECISRINDRIFFIEAKSSFANPSGEGGRESFRKNIDDIKQKFLNSVLLYSGLLNGRPYISVSQLPVSLDSSAVRRKDILLVLIIKGFESEWLKDIDDALNQECRTLTKTWAISSVKVINDSMALKYNIISSS